MLESNPVLNTTWHFSERLDWHLKDLLEVDIKLELPFGAQNVFKKRVGLAWRNLSKSDRKKDTDVCCVNCLGLVREMGIQIRRTQAVVK